MLKPLQWRVVTAKGVVLANERLFWSRVVALTESTGTESAGSHRYVTPKMNCKLHSLMNGPFDAIYLYLTFVGGELRGTTG